MSSTNFVLIGESWETAPEGMICSWCNCAIGQFTRYWSLRLQRQAGLLNDVVCEACALVGPPLEKVMDEW